MRTFPRTQTSRARSRWPILVRHHVPCMSCPSVCISLSIRLAERSFFGLSMIVALRRLGVLLELPCESYTFSRGRPRTGRPHSGGSQFFMNLSHNTSLDWFSPGASKHPVFGQITEGYEIAMEISEVSTARQPTTRSSLHRAHVLCRESAVHRPCTDRAHISCELTSTHKPHTSKAPTTGDNPNTPIMMKSITISGL